MRIFCILCGLFLAIAIVNCSPIVKRETEEDLNPLNEVYVLEIDDGEATDDGERGNREKRKIGIKLGIANGIISFVFGKLDSFLDAKTRALAVLDDGNRAKNAAFGIDANPSATSQFLSNLLSQKIQGLTGSIGPLINSATTLVSGASSGLTNTLLSKAAPLSSLLGSLSGGAGASAGGSSTGGSNSVILGNLLSQKVNTISSLSQGFGGLAGLSGGNGAAASNGNAGISVGTSAGANAGASTGINLGAFANLEGKTTTTTTEDTPVFDRNKVSLDIPSNAFSTGFTLITNISKVLNSVILNSARRTQTFLEIFKPFFRGAFAIKGLPSDKSN